MSRAPVCSAALCVVAGFVLSVGCGDGSVGLEPCTTQGSACSAQGLRGNDAVGGAENRVPVARLKEIEPTWVRPLPFSQTVPAMFLTSNARAYYHLSAGLRNEALLFDLTSVNGDLRVSRLDDRGDATLAAMIAAPPGALAEDGDTLPSFWPNLGSFSRSPSATVVWTSCPKPTCLIPQKLIFAGGIDAAPVRTTLDSQLDDALVDDHGDVYVLHAGSGTDLSVSKLDRSSGAPLWIQRNFSSGWVPQLDFDQGAVHALNAVLLGDGRLAAAAYRVERQPASGEQSLFFIDAVDGEVSAPWFSAFNFGQQSLRVFNRQLISVAADEQSDLVVLRVLDHEQSVQSLTFTRQDFTSLAPRAIALDPSGNVYVSLSSGARDLAKPTLCRATPTNTGSCVTLPIALLGPDLPVILEEMVAQDGGVLLIRSGAYLMRVQFPI